MGFNGSPAHQAVGDAIRWIPVGLIPIGNGIVRLALPPSILGEAAGWYSAGLDAALILAYAWALSPPPRPAVRAGTWVACTTLLHFALGGLVLRMSLADLLAKYDLRRGEPWLLVNVAIALAPSVGARLRARAARRRARVVILVGPKGAGKTTLGELLARVPGGHFLDVEAISRGIRAEVGRIDERYARRVFSEVVRAVRSLEAAHRFVVLETTGASRGTPALLAALRRRHDVRLVRVRAGREACAARILARDPAKQVPVPPELVREMHARSEALALPWDLEVVNDPPLDADQALQRLREVLDGLPPPTAAGEAAGETAGVS